MLMRRKVLLAALGELDKKGKLGKLAIVKTLFILAKEYGLSTKISSFYSFFPYKFGPFSNVAYYDLGWLQRNDFIGEDLRLTDRGLEECKPISEGMIEEIGDCVSRFPSADSMKKYVYGNYPEFTEKANGTKEKTLPSCFFTIGYEGKNIDEFLNLLMQNKIAVLADVRSNPFSMNFCFIKNRLNHYLGKVGIRYLHFPNLGIKSERRKNLNSVKEYSKLFSEYERDVRNNPKDFLMLMEIGKKERTVLMCLESLPENCHRGVLAKCIRSAGIEVVHL